MEKIEKRIAELRQELSKLIKVKSANPMEIIERTRKIHAQIGELERKRQSNPQ